MTGMEIYNNALNLLGYNENNGNTQMTNRVMTRALSNINLVLTDLQRVCGTKLKRVENLTVDIELPEKAIEICICGVASYIALAEGDNNMQYVWSSEYQARRAMLSRTEKIKDTLPRIGY